MNTETIYNVLLDEPRQIDGKTWHGLSYQLTRDESGKIEVREHGWPTKLTIYEADGPELDALDETTVKAAIEAALPVDEAYVIPPPPVPYVPLVTAEQHLASVGLAGDRQPTLLYLRLNLQSAGKTSPELDQLEAYLSGILSIFAADPSPRNDWPQPPITFEAAVQSAMQTLNPLVP
jgi:hypothetical protein